MVQQVQGRLGNVPILLADPLSYLASCRQQLAILERDAEATVRVIEQQFASANASLLANRRAAAMIEAIQGQVADITQLLSPLIPEGPADLFDDGAARAFPPLLQYVHNLFRDWGWPLEEGGENEQALALVNGVLGGRPTGRMLVIGAGAGRLAYDLHRAAPGNSTVALDVDPLLITVAHLVTRGGSVIVREANAEIDELDRVSRPWTLRAPHGAVDPGRFQCVVANGLNPPFDDGSFDTVLTPWFIDLIPPDLRGFIDVVGRLLSPNGRWVNIGPLRYTAQTPLPLRYTREEVFDLAELAGLTVSPWRIASLPYLVSKNSGRGKVEWVLCFSAARSADSKLKKSSYA